jgi:hypothetical protein
MLTCIQAGARYSQSPVDAAMMESACSPEFRGRWSVLLTFQEKVRKRTAGRDTVAGAINSRIPVPLLPVNELAMNLAS